MSFVNFLLIALIFAGALSRGAAVLYIFFGSFALGSVAVIPPEWVAGVTLTPPWIYAIILSLRAIMLERNWRQALAPLFDLRQLGLLSLCSVYGTISALFFPRLFRDSITVIPMHLVLHVAIPLEPSNANITQMIYLWLTTATTLGIYLMARDATLRRHLLNALLFGGVIMLASGVLDMATAATGTQALLDPLRTATYALLTNVEVASARRVVGLQPEASAYAGACMDFLAPIYFLRRVYMRNLGRSPVWVNGVWIALALMTYLSTSSTGFVGLAVLILAALAELISKAAQRRRDGWTGLGLAWLGLVLVACVFALDPAWFDPMFKMINMMVFQKSASSSYVERSMWNTLALRAFSSTWGLGAGLGSVRASSWVASVLGNVGAIGAALMFGFLLRAGLARPRLSPDDLCTAAKYALIPILAMLALSGTSVGFGLMVASLAALVEACCRPHPAGGQHQP